MARRHWLLELDVDGTTLRWSTRRREVETASGDTLVYLPGLTEEPQISQGEEVSVQIVDPSQDWTTVPERTERAPTRLLLWEEGTLYEQAEVYSRGVAMAPTYGPRGRLSWDIQEDGDGDGDQVPDLLAVVDESTWPITTSPTHQVPDDSVGVYYPVIFGLPGYVPGRATPYPVVPLPIAQFRAASLGSTYYVVGDRPLPVIGSDVYVQQVDADLSAWLTAAKATDLLGRDVTVVPAGTTIPGSVTERKAIYAGFVEAEGGGEYRGAYDVIAWMLRTWAGRTDVDWARMRDAEWLNAYKVDTWINAPTKPWAWIQGTLLRFLPATIQRGSRGRYLERDRYSAQRSEARGTLDTARRDWERQSDVRWASVDVANEITIEYRKQRTGVWTARRVLTARTEAVGQRVYSTTDERVSADSRCIASFARYGYRPSDVIQVPWTWDDATIRLLLEDEASRRALPWREVSGWVRDGMDLRAGDVYLLSDADAGLSSAVAIVAEPPVVARGGAIVQFRLPWT